MIFNDKDLCDILNVHLEINDILLLRKSFKNDFKILKCHNFRREITFGKQYYINKQDYYDLNILIYDNFKVFNDEDLNLISKYDNFNIEILYGNGLNENYFISENYYLLEFLKNCFNSNKINILYININTFYILCNYLKNYNYKNINLNTLHIKMSANYDKFLYWDLTLYNLKECLKHFKKCKNLIFGNVVICSTYLNSLKKHNIVKNIEVLHNISDKYLKKNNIKIKVVINSLNINNYDINYNMYFDCENDLLTDIN